VAGPYNKNFRPVALTLGGFDPSGGAGVLADIKTFEMNKVYGLAVNTCITIQSDRDFHSVKWMDEVGITDSLILLSKRYKVKAVKLGMHKNLESVLFTVRLLKKTWPACRIVWDPVMKSSSGYDLNWQPGNTTLGKILSKIDLVTPNLPEFEKLKTVHGRDLSEAGACLIKGGHSQGKTSEDLLFENGKLKKTFVSKRIRKGEKHGSGCVFSSAITANLAKGLNLPDSVFNAKKYIRKFLKSNSTLSGYHY
jgi:hydroxymethylpyrimidine/phosphomethylpyrimidine kinase